MHLAEVSFEVDCFLYIVDKAHSSFALRFGQLQTYETTFSFLFDF